MADLSLLSHSPDVAELMQRMLRLRARFMGTIPENVAALKQHIRESDLSGKGGGINDAELFFNVANVFDRAPGPITMGELSRGLNVPLSTATRMMDWLVKNGYGRRFPDPADRRIVRVELTETGRETYETIRKFARERIEQILGQFTAEERATFISLLNKVVTILETNF